MEAKPATEAQYRAQCEKKNQSLQQLRRLLDQGNRRIEALATVVQHLFTEVTLEYVWVLLHLGVLFCPLTLTYMYK